MELFRQQVSTQHIESGEFLGKDFGINETLSHEHVFTDQLQIRYYHRNWPEEGLQPLWKLGSTQVTRVHRNEHPACNVQGNLISLKDESFLILFYCICDALELD